MMGERRGYQMSPVTGETLDELAARLAAVEAARDAYAAQVIGQSDDLIAVRAEREEAHAALNCRHNHADPDELAELWGYTEHDGETWSRCNECGLLELWAAGNFIRAALRATETGDA